MKLNPAVTILFSSFLILLVSSAPRHRKKATLLPSNSYQHQLQAKEDGSRSGSQGYQESISRSSESSEELQGSRRQESDNSVGALVIKANLSESLVDQKELSLKLIKEDAKINTANNAGESHEEKSSNERLEEWAELIHIENRLKILEHNFEKLEVDKQGQVLIPQSNSQQSVPLANQEPAHQQQQQQPVPPPNQERQEPTRQQQQRVPPPQPSMEIEKVKQAILNSLVLPPVIPRQQQPPPFGPPGALAPAPGLFPQNQPPQPFSRPGQFQGQGGAPLQRQGTGPFQEQGVAPLQGTGSFQGQGAGPGQ